MVTEGPLSAAQIYEQITGGKGTQSLGAAHDSASQLTNRMVERAQRISSLRAKTMSGWQGGAGDAAADATLPLVQAAADDAVHLKTAQTAVGAQMDAFGTAKNSVKPVAPQPPEITAADLLHAINGDGVDSYRTKVTSWQADSQANIDAFSAYHSASGTNGGQMPAQYAQLADSGTPVAMTTPGQGTDSKTTGKTGPTDTGEWARNPRQPQVPSQQNRQTVQPGQNQVQPQLQNQVQSQTQNQFQHQVQQPGTGNPDNTHANSYVPKPVLPPAAQSGYEFGPTGQPGNNFGGNTTFGPGTGGYSSGFGPGSGTGTGTGYRPGTGPGTGTGTGMRGPGVNTGARMPEERLPGGAVRGAAGARGANGMPMGAPAGGRGGKEEDKEKKAAAYLRNPDPEETFGGFTEKPMPPVIGEHRPKN
ncbi:PPE domain-containing protein [Amycolatopsis mongoliensis]|uniref:PPE domain-containing protein n=1 Tax=Amycolatopsis mongoliensis TaxID=715475 RepID=A0A9Y2JSK9_9PSEU|nr:PPE domain-containing protein [Amycolatopsis sp. 4-36]WIY03890.1 PPE domain-containing protein [Amycolatopsis sp. 4-36]